MRRGSLSLSLDPGPAPQDDPYALPGLRLEMPPRDMAPTQLNFTRADGGGKLRMERETFVAKVDEDGSIRFSDKANWQSEGVQLGKMGAIGYGARFDITEAIMRAAGMDPYMYEKYKYMEETREERMGMALVARAGRLKEAVHGMPKVLDRLFADGSLSWPARRRALFELWDDCLEASDRDSDEDSLGASRTIRAMIVATVRRRLPAGSEHGYTASELDELNGARRSRDRFDPYAQP